MPCTRPSAVSIRVSVLGILNPSMYRSWDRPISTAAAEVNPEMTAWLSRFTMKPSRSNPRTIWKIPTMKDSVKAYRAYSSGVSASYLCSAECVRRDTSATGPIAICRDVPNRLYMNTGTSEA